MTVDAETLSRVNWIEWAADGNVSGRFCVPCSARSAKEAKPRERKGWVLVIPSTTARLVEADGCLHGRPSVETRGPKGRASRGLVAKRPLLDAVTSRGVETPLEVNGQKDAGRLSVS